MRAQAADEEQEPQGSQREPGGPPPSIEEIIVLGVESESAADFAGADSVVGFNAEDLAAIGAESIEDLAIFTPNLEIVTSGSTTPTFFIRGVGLNDFNPNSTGAVAIYQDDIAINAPALQLGTLFDTEAVNIERGPRGTGLGRNASAGVIRLYSRKPSGDFGGFLRADFGNYNAMDYEGAVEAPIYEDMLAGRLAFRFSDRDGTMKNRCGRAPPIDERVPWPGPTQPSVIAPWSICGESVTEVNPEAGNQFISDIPNGLARWVNDTHNWAARGTLSFQPVLEQNWLINAHGSRRNEYSRLGQSIGTGGNYCRNGKICSAPFAGVPPALRDPTARSGGVLGGPVNGSDYQFSYAPIEIRKEFQKRAPCVVSQLGCGTQPLAVRLAANEVKINIARELAKRLDDEPWEGDFDHTGPTKNDTYGGYVHGEVALPWDVQMTTSGGYDHYDRLFDYDLDFSPEVLFEIQTDDKAWQYYQDVNFSREMFGDVLPVIFDVGGWGFTESLDADVVNNLGNQTALGVGSRQYTQDATSLGAYASFTFDFWEDYTLDGGVRYNVDRKHLDMSVFTGVTDQFTLTDTWTAPSGELRLTYRFRDDTHVYWKYTRGWKPGTYNATASQFRGPTTADPEKIDAFETGIRGAWFDGQVELNTSFFYYKYTDYQIFTAQQFFGGVPEFVILNANDAEVYGSEVDAAARPWEYTFVNVRFAWLETQFLDFVRMDQFLSPTGGTGELLRFRESQYSGNPLLNSPRYKISLTGEQSVPLGRFGTASLRYDGVWTDTTYYDPTKGTGLGDLQGKPFLPKQTVAQEPFWMHNLRLGWTSPDERVNAAVWVRNLTNEAYKTFAFDGSAFRRTTIYFVNDPRTYGGSIQINF